jgi:hypothetical protein
MIPSSIAVTKTWDMDSEALNSNSCNLLTICLWTALASGFVLFYFVFETRSCYVVQANLKIMALLPQPLASGSICKVSLPNSSYVTRPSCNNMRYPIPPSMMEGKGRHCGKEGCRNWRMRELVRQRKKEDQAGCSWLMPVILVTWEAEIGGSWFESCPANSSWNPHLHIYVYGNMHIFKVYRVICGIYWSTFRECLKPKTKTVFVASK